jgi:ankyrin repeat protein
MVSQTRMTTMTNGEPSGATMQSASRAGYNALWRAISGRNPDMLRKLIEEGGNPNALDADGDPLLHDPALWAPNYDLDPQYDVRSRHQLVQVMLELGADPHALDGDGRNVLICPIMAGDAVMIELLLKLGVDPNFGCGDEGSTIYDAGEFEWSIVQGLYDRNSLPRRAACRDLLRQYGAFTRSEIAVQIGGDGSEQIDWRDGRWQLCAAKGFY